MITFKCRKCGFSKEASDKYAGKHVRCPKCNAVNIVGAKEPAKPAPKKETIKFYCPSCGQKIGLGKEYAGKRVRCAKCKNPLEVPSSSQGKRVQPVEETSAILQAFGEEPAPAGEAAKDDFGFDFPADMGDMLQMDEGEESYNLAPPVETADDIASKQQSAMLAAYSEGGGGAYEGPVEKSSNTKLFIIIGSVAAGIVLLVVIMVGLFSTLGGGREERKREEVDYTAAEEFANAYLQLLIDGDSGQTWQLISPQIREEFEKEDLVYVTSFLADTTDYELVQRSNYFMEERDEYIFGFSYDVWAGERQKTFFIMLEPSNNSFIVQGLRGVDEDSEDIFEAFVEIVPGGQYDTFLRLEKPEVYAVLSMIRGIGTTTFCFIMIVFVLLVILFLISMCIVFSKAGQPAWAALVPGYNMWVLAEIADKPGWYGLFVVFGPFVPFVGLLVQLVFSFIIDVGVAKSFNKGTLFGIGLFLLPMIFYPILAFSRD